MSEQVVEPTPLTNFGLLSEDEANAIQQLAQERRENPDHMATYEKVAAMVVDHSAEFALVTKSNEETGAVEPSHYVRIAGQDLGTAVKNGSEEKFGLPTPQEGMKTLLAKENAAQSAEEGQKLEEQLIEEAHQALQNANRIYTEINDQANGPELFEDTRTKFGQNGAAHRAMSQLKEMLGDPHATPDDISGAVQNLDGIIEDYNKDRSLAQNTVDTVTNSISSGNQTLQAVKEAVTPMTTDGEQGAAIAGLKADAQQLSDGLVAVHGSMDEATSAVTELPAVHNWRTALDQLHRYAFSRDDYEGVPNFILQTVEEMEQDFSSIQYRLTRVDETQSRSKQTIAAVLGQVQKMLASPVLADVK